MISIARFCYSATMNPILAEITWRPSIGDPDALGWSITLTYFIVSWLCLSAGRAQQTNQTEQQTFPWFWFGLGAAMIAMGLNKQLDLQVLAIQIGRQLAIIGDWYDRRRSFKAVVVFAAAGLGLVGLITGFYVMRKSWRQYVLAYLGILILLAFVALRASPLGRVEKSLNQIPWLIHTLNATLELGGLFLIGLGAWFNSLGLKRQTLSE